MGQLKCGLFPSQSAELYALQLSPESKSFSQHEALKLPSCHLKFNPTELMWESLKCFMWT
jgi:hypothetical protein